MYARYPSVLLCVALVGNHFLSTEELFNGLNKWFYSTYFEDPVIWILLFVALMPISYRITKYIWFTLVDKFQPVVVNKGKGIDVTV